MKEGKELIKDVVSSGDHLSLYHRGAAKHEWLQGCPTWRQRV